MKKTVFIVLIIMALMFGVTACGTKELKENDNREFSREELSEMALDYFMQNNTHLLDRKDYSVGISDEVIPKYQNKDMVVIEIRHINGSINALDARYYINVYTAKGFDDLENEINLNV